MPKKVLAPDYRKQQSPPMSSPYTYTVSQASVGASSTLLGEEDDDDICPVCESECTCHNRGSPFGANRNSVLTRTSTFTSTSSSPPKPPPSQTLQPLKIKLTVPPNLKFHKNLAASSSSSSIRHAPHPQNRTESSSTTATMLPQVTLGVLDPSAPKRRGRPPKAVVAAREAAKAALTSVHATHRNNPTHAPARKDTHASGSKSAVTKAKNQSFSTSKGRASTKSTKKTGKRSAPAVPASSHAYSSDEEAHYPTFMTAASSSFLTSSSESPCLESSDSSESSDSEPDDKFYSPGAEGDKNRLKNGGDPFQKRRDHASSNRWEIKPRKQSVDPEVLGGDADSEDDSGSDDGADDEDDSDDEDEGEDEDEEGAAEADVEEEGLAEVEEDRDMEEGDGKLGVSFGGLPTGWSEDEESSFDADLFFANLDDSSDSCGSPAALRLDTFGSDVDVDSNGSFSGDEEDALLLMDIDSSVQIRRSNGEFEVGVELDGLSLGPDGQLLLPTNFGHFAAFEGGFDPNTTDVDMTVLQEDSSPDDEASDVAAFDATGVILEESDGETTEDELVDSNGLPNQKAMALFRWPAPISTVDPLSTVSQSTAVEDGQQSPPISNTLRHALEAMSVDRQSPAENISGSMDELEFIDQHAETLRLYDEAGRTPGVPSMGQFVNSPTIVHARHAVIDGTGVPIPSPFPRSKISRRRKRKVRVGDSARGLNLTTNIEAGRLDSATPFVSVYPPSSDEFGSQSHAQTSDDPSSTDAIDLDDVLDVAFLDSETTMFDSDMPTTWYTPSTPTASAPPETLNRWDRIPVGTFRRTRETSMLESTPGSDSGIASLYPAISALLNNDMLSTPKTKGKMTNSKKRTKAGTSGTLVISPVLLPVRDRDGDRTPTGNGHALYNPFQQNDQTHQQKSRKELRKEKAMMKRKMIGKHAQPSPRNHQHSHRHHYPNMKTRGTSSVQRFASSSHVPHLNL